MARGRPPKYPWDFFLNEKLHIIKAVPADQWERGADEDVYPDSVQVKSFRAECHAAATRRGGKVTTHIMGTTVSVRYEE